VDDYNGWIIGYNAATLQQTAVLNVTANGAQGHSGQRRRAGGRRPGNLYDLVANGTFDTTLNSHGFPSKGDLAAASSRSRRPAGWR